MIKYFLSLALLVSLNVNANSDTDIFTYEEEITANCTGFFCNAAWACKNQVKIDNIDEETKLLDYSLLASARVKNEDFSEGSKYYKVYRCSVKYTVFYFD